jgi:hypothetical protein
MAVREVLKTFTFEQQRQEINRLSSDVGDASSLSTTSKVVTQAINDIVSGTQSLVDATLSGDLTINGGDIYLQNAATDIFIRDNVLNALLITEGANPYISIDTVNGSELVTIHKNTLVGGNLTVNGDITFRAGQGSAGSITLGDGNTDNVIFGADVNSNIIPNTNNTYSLGSLNQIWSSLFVSSITSGTNADVTIDPNGTGDFIFKGGTGQNFVINDGTVEKFRIDSSNGDVYLTGGITIPNGIAMQDNTADAFTIKEGTNKYVSIDTLNGAEKVTLHKNVDILGDLFISGTTTTINSTTLSVDDKNIELGSVGTPSDATADGGGITLKSSVDKTIKWLQSSGAWEFNTPVKIQDGLKISQNTIVNDNTTASDITVTPGTDRVVILDTRAGFVVPKGTTAQRPTTPIATNGLVRFNTTTNELESFVDNEYVSLTEQFKYGITAPSNSLGNNGDFYFDKVRQDFYGPKEGGTWPSPICIKEDKVENVIYVSKGGSDTTYDGSTPAKAFKSIKRAAEAARATTGNTTIKVASGDYYEDNPIYLPKGTTVIGDNLRETIVRPLNDGVDMFWVTSGCYLAQFVMRDNYGDPSNSADALRGVGLLNSGINPFINSTTTTFNLFPGHNLKDISGIYKDGANMLQYKRTDTINYAYAQLVAGYPSLVIPPTNFTGNLTNGNAIVLNVSSIAGLEIGDVVTGTNITPGTTILSIDGPTQITLSAPALAGESVASLSVPGDGKCKRDLGLILDAIIHDLKVGGNVKSILAGESYRDANGNLQYITTEFVETKYAIEQLRLRARQVVTDTAIISESGFLAQFPAVTIGDCSNVQTNIDTLFGIVVSILDGADSPAYNPGPGYLVIDQEWMRVDDITGNAVTVSTNGRGVANPITGAATVAAEHPNGAVVTQGGRIFRYAVSYPDQTGIKGAGRINVSSSTSIVTGTNTKFISQTFAGGVIKVGNTSYTILSVQSDTQLTLATVPSSSVSATIYKFIPPKERIFLSPYVQNCSVISVLGQTSYDSSLKAYDASKTRAGGLLIDGANLLTDTPLKSMVADAFTQVVFNSVGFHLKNDSYAQLVSVFEIFEDVGVLCETGGYASVTNSATNFGNEGLKAIGYSPVALPFYSNGRVAGITNITKTSFATSASGIVGTSFSSVLSGAKTRVTVRVSANDISKFERGQIITIANHTATPNINGTGIEIETVRFSDNLFTFILNTPFLPQYGPPYAGGSTGSVTITSGSTYTKVTAINFQKSPQANQIVKIDQLPSLPDGEYIVDEVFVFSPPDQNNTCEFSLVQKVPNADIPLVPNNAAIELRSPSSVNSSSHTFEYVGSGTNYMALPTNGGRAVTSKQSVEIDSGKCYVSATDQDGNFTVGPNFNVDLRTGKATFTGAVAIGILDSLQLKGSPGTPIFAFSTNTDLGGSSGRSDQILPTQKAVRDFVVDKVGPFFDLDVGTSPQPGLVVQLDGTGKINRDQIPPQEPFNVYVVDTDSERLVAAIPTLSKTVTAHTIGSNVLTLNNLIGVEIGYAVTGTNVPPNGLVDAKVLSINTGANQITLDVPGANFTSQISGTITIKNATPLKVGDFVVQTNTSNPPSRSYILASLPATVNNNWQVISSEQVDASQIVSGIVSPARLGTRIANENTFLSGLSKYVPLPKGVRAVPNQISGTTIITLGSDGPISVKRTATSVNISSAFYTGGGSPTFTFNTATAHGLSNNDYVEVDGVSPGSYNGYYQVTVVDGDTFTVPAAVNPGVYVTGGTVTKGDPYRTGFLDLDVNIAKFAAGQSTGSSEYGVASFDYNTFEMLSSTGFSVTLRDKGVSLSKIENIGPRSLLGNTFYTEQNVSEVPLRGFAAEIFEYETIPNVNGKWEINELVTNRNLGERPQLQMVVGQSIKFILKTENLGHPMFITTVPGQTGTLANPPASTYNIGVTKFVSSVQSNGSGVEVGEVIVTVTQDTPTVLYYQDGSDASNYGVINITNFRGTTVNVSQTFSTIAPVIIDSFSARDIYTGKYLIQIHNKPLGPTNVQNQETKYLHSTELMIVHDGIDVMISEYGTLWTKNLGEFTAVLNNNIVSVIYTPTPVNGIPAGNPGGFWTGLENVISNTIRLSRDFLT